MSLAIPAFPAVRFVARILAAAAMLALVPHVFAADPAPSPKIDPAVASALDAAPQAQVTVLIALTEQADLSEAARIEDWNARGWAVYNALRATAGSTQPAVLQRIDQVRASGHASAVKPLWIVNAISLKADRIAIEQLAALREVGAIVPSLKVEVPPLVPEPDAPTPNAVEWGVDKIGAPLVWSVYGATGAGVVVANVDTGVQFDHPALVSHYRGNLGSSFDHNYNWYDPTGAHNSPFDDNNHGSHTMGTIVGGDGGTNQIGVAPGARWIAAYGCCPSNTDLLEAQQFMLAPTDLAGNNPDPTKRPHVLNQSWGGPGGSQIFENVIAHLRASGIFPAFSAGNNGSSAADGCGRLGSPGDNPSAFSVGNTTSTDTLSGSSSRGPNPITGEVGPEVSAPGSSVRSSVTGSSYAVFSGTSMASPHVAGAVALLISLEPKLAGRVDELEELLRKTAVPLTSAQACGGVAGSQVPNNGFGWGRIDVKAAADLVVQSGWIEGTVTVGGVPTAGVPITFSRLGKTLTTQSAADGNYRVVAGAGNWSMTASLHGQSASAPVVVVTDDGTTDQDFALAANTTFNVAGVVTQVGTGTPIRAMILIANQKLLAPVWSDAVTGAYSLNVPTGSANLVVSHPGYQTLTQAVSAGGTVNLQMTPQQNYTCRDNTDAGGPVYSWSDATDGTAFPLGDDAASANVTLPGTFTYYGSDFTTVRINSNGFLFFGTTAFTTANMYLPFEGRPNNDVMAFGEDLNPETGTQGNIFAKTVGTQLVVQYHQVQHWANGFPETFQIILDTTSDTITYQYNTLSWPDFTSVGVENAAGSAGQIYSFRNSANLVPGRAVQFTPATGTAVNWGCDHAFTLTIADDIDPVAASSLVTYRIHWNLTGFGGAPQVNLTAAVPANATFVAASGGATPVAGVLSWNLGNQRPNAEGSAWFTMRATSGPQIVASATIADSSIETRSATATTAVGPAADALFRDGFENP